MSVEIEQSKTLQNLARKKAEGNLQDGHREALEAAHDFKLGWAVLGATLLKVQRGKNYRGWGFSDFKTFCSKELGLRYSTAEKLIRSTYYMQRHEPKWLDRSEAIDIETPTPDLNAVNFLARGEEAQAIPSELQHNLHKEVFEGGATGLKVGRMASAELGDEARAALGLRAPGPEDPTTRAAITTSRDVEKVLRGLKRVEAPGDVQRQAEELLAGVRRWQAGLETQP
jgi:hypothetical protein